MPHDLAKIATRLMAPLRCRCQLRHCRIWALIPPGSAFPQRSRARPSGPTRRASSRGGRCRSSPLRPQVKELKHRPVRDGAEESPPYAASLGVENRLRGRGVPGTIAWVSVLDRCSPAEHRASTRHPVAERVVGAPVSVGIRVVRLAVASSAKTSHLSP